ncbi:MAG: EI24 domain-containing protein [Epsilonproteobacteria bacterium]|nr:EI24 domain-containing protein [Campylobacterota bacterium]
MELIVQSFKDLFSPRLLKYSIIPFLVISALMYVLFFSIASMGLDQLTHVEVNQTQTVIQNGVEHTQSNSIVADIQDSSIYQFLMSYAITSWVISFFVYVVGGFFVFYLSLFFSIFIIGFLTPYIIKELHLLHYSDIELKGFGNVFESVLLTLKWAFVMILLFFLLVPLYFIPIVNIIAVNFPLYYFFHKMLNYDVASSICTKEEFKAILATKTNELRLKSLFLYLISMIPYAVLFATVYFVVYMGHSYFRYVEVLRQRGGMIES